MVRKYKGSREEYEQKLGRVMGRLGVRVYDYDWSRRGCWVQMVYAGRAYALLGDHEAAKRLTKKGALLPCPFCGYDIPELGDAWGYYPECRCYGPTKDSYWEGILAWNTRAPILSAEEMEVLEGME